MRNLNGSLHWLAYGRYLIFAEISDPLMGSLKITAFLQLKSDWGKLIPFLISMLVVARIFLVQINFRLSLYDEEVIF